MHAQDLNPLVEGRRGHGKRAGETAFRVIGAGDAADEAFARRPQHHGASEEASMPSAVAASAIRSRNDGSHGASAGASFTSAAQRSIAALASPAWALASPR